MQLGFKAKASFPTNVLCYLCWATIICRYPYFIISRKGHCYDQYFQRFSRFPAKKLAFFLKTNVMIQFLQKVAAFQAKNANFFAKCLAFKKIVTSVPDNQTLKNSIWKDYFSAGRCEHLWGPYNFVRQWMSQLLTVFFSSRTGWPDEFVKRSPKI
jgi:hypothetical protein